MRGRREAFGEEAVDLLDAAFVEALCLHHFVEQRNVERHDGDRAAGLRDERLVHAHPCVALVLCELRADAIRSLFEVLLRAADRAIAINRPREVRPDVAVGRRDHTRREHASGIERIHPHFPIFAAHHRDRVRDLRVVRGLDGDVAHGALVGVHGLVCVSRAERLQRALMHYARLRMRASRRRERVDDCVHRA